MALAGSRGRSMRRRSWSNARNKHETLLTQDRDRTDVGHLIGSGHSAVKDLVSTEGLGEGI